MSQDGRSQGGGGCGGSAATTSPQGSPPITLSVPRPEHQRTTNLYVDTPFKHRVAPRPRPPHHHNNHHLHHHHNTATTTTNNSSSSSSSSHHHHHHHHVHHHHIHHATNTATTTTTTTSPTSPSSSSSSPASGRTTATTHADLALVHGTTGRTSGKRPTKLFTTTTGTTTTSATTTTTGGGGGVTGTLPPMKGSNTTSSIATMTTSSSSSSPTLLLQQQQSGSRTPVISKQPAALTFTKGRREESSSDGGESIICSWCGRCRCEACTKPRSPPAAWLCRNKCLCSPAAAVDYASCLCCVKGVLYHCGKDGENGLAAAADHPCSCGGPHALLSWACLAVASIPLPCLLCYWPLTGARRVVETTYQRCTSHGCRCPQGRNPRLQQQQPPPPPPPEKRPLHDCA